jgi:amidophosphoribosyltransferase
MWATPSAGAGPGDRLPGQSAIGHTRYSTAGGSFIRNVQPMFADLEAGGIALRPQRQPDQLPDPARAAGRRRAIFQSTSDSEVILHCSPARGRRGR